MPVTQTLSQSVSLSVAMPCERLGQSQLVAFHWRDGNFLYKKSPQRSMLIIFHPFCVLLSDHSCSVLGAWPRIGDVAVRLRFRPRFRFRSRFFEWCPALFPVSFIFASAPSELHASGDSSSVRLVDCADRLSGGLPPHPLGYSPALQDCGYMPRVHLCRLRKGCY